MTFELLAILGTFLGCTLSNVLGELATTRRWENVIERAYCQSQCLIALALALWVRTLLLAS